MSLPEGLVTLATTTLSAGMNNSQTSMSVTGFAGFPAGLQFRVAIDTELLLVTAGAGTTTWTVVRGIEGTTAAAHSSGAAVVPVITAAGIALITEQPAGPLSIPALSDFGWVNQFIAQASDSGHGVFMSMKGADGLRMLVLSIAAAPFTVTCRVHGVVTYEPSFYPFVGVCIHDTSSGKIELTAYYPSYTALQFDAERWTNFSTPSAGIGAPYGYLPGPISSVWLRIRDDGSNRHFEFSLNGYDFLEITNEASGSYVTPDKAGLVIRSNGSNTQQVDAWFDGFLITYP